MTFSCFVDFLFEVVDLWVSTINLKEYPPKAESVALRAYFIQLRVFLGTSLRRNHKN